MSSRTGPIFLDAPIVPPLAAARVSREALLARIAEDPHLPSPPGLILRVLERASQRDCTPASLAAVIHRDPALCGKILKAVNSALYRLPRSISSIERAVALLGLKPVRSLVLSLSLPAIQRQLGTAPSLESFWKESVAGAIVAQELALRLRRPNPEDDLVAGLLRDIGVLALRQIAPASHDRLLARPIEERTLRQCYLEEELFGVHHAEVGAHVLRRWRLPEDITEAIRHHHAPDHAGLPQLIADRARLLDFASRVAQLKLGGSEAEMLRDLLVLARDHYGMTEAELTAFLQPLARKIEEFAAVMDIEIGRCDDYTRIMTRAAEELVKLTVETSVDKLRILEQKQQAEQETRLWREQAARLHKEAMRDPLTGAFNRGCFENELERQFRRARRRGTVLGPVFLDLDDFKGLNDLFGHRILREMADKLFAAVRHGDVVARYGGDEFCVLVENTSPAGLRAMADRLWQDLNDRAVREGGQTIAVRASIGAVLCLPQTYAGSAADILTAADQAMYAAKMTGKNQVAFVSLLSAADEATLRAVEGQLFSVWLSERGIWKPQHLGIGVRRSAARFEAPGRLAVRLGWLSIFQRAAILHRQRTTRRRFHDIALERGDLTAGQLHALLALQLEPPDDLAANLVNQGIAGEPAMRENLRKYYHGLSGS
jgi:diguanylate cyclase (GGDEF)-like protein